MYKLKKLKQQLNSMILKETEEIQEKTKAKDNVYVKRSLKDRGLVNPPFLLDQSIRYGGKIYLIFLRTFLIFPKFSQEFHVCTNRYQLFSELQILDVIFGKLYKYIISYGSVINTSFFISI
jgi:hypothetical protein